MVQTKRKTNVIALAILLCFALLLGVAMIFVAPARDTAQAEKKYAEFNFWNLNGEANTAGTGSRTNGGITFSYSGNYVNSPGTSNIYLSRNSGSFTLIVKDSDLKAKNITKVTYSLSQDYGYGGDADISLLLKRGKKGVRNLSGTWTIGSYSGDLQLTLTNNSSTDLSKAYTMTFQLYGPSQVAVTVSAGTGVKEVFLSSAQNGSPAATSGSTFAENTTVYAFAKLDKGYQAKSGWTLVSGSANSENAVYMTGSKKITTSNKDFGTINADVKTRVIALNGNGAENGTNITLLYGQENTAGALVRDGYTFLGWNTSADGTGTSFGDSSGAALSIEQVNAILDDGSITAFYAMWKAEINTVIAYIDAIGDVEYTQACKDKIDKARTIYDSLGTEDKELVTNYKTLNDAEATYNGMQADKDALDAYKTTKKADADSLGTSNDSAACEELIATAKQDIDDIAYDCTKTLAENKAMADDIITALESDLYNQRQADGVAEYIDAISDPVTLASKPDINTARALYDGLSDKQKPLVGNYDKLTDAEAAYADILMNCEAKIGNVYYLTLLDAFTAAAEDATVTINKDYSISGRGDPYVNVNKDVTIDLAGRTLTIGQGTIVVTEGAVLSICNSAPATGGIKGVAGVDPTYGAYVLLYDCRLVLNAETVKQYATINHIAKGYLVEDLNGGAADENGYCSIVRPIAVEEVIGAIEAIDDPVVYTDDCKAKIDEARALYDGLAAESQAEVTNYETLTDAEAIYDGMHSDKEALDAYKVERKGDADDLALEGDSVACEQLISDAKAAVDAVFYDCTKTLAENKAVVDAIIDALDSDLALQRDKDAFEAYKPTKKGAADALALEGDSAACEDMIADAKAAIDALTYDEDKDLDANKALLDGIVADLADALDLQRDKEVFNAYKEPQKGAADALGEETDSTACKDLIKGAKDAIDALTYDEDKDLDANKALLDGIVADLADALDLQRDKEAFEEYRTMQKSAADALGEETDSTACKDLIKDAQTAIDALTYDEDKDLDANKAMLDVIVADLADALDLQRNKEAFEAYKDAQTDAADALALEGDSATCEGLIADAKADIDALTYDENEDLDANKALIDDIVAGLADALAAQRDEDAADAVDALIDSIPTPVVYPTSKEAIVAARNAFDALTDEQKALVDDLEYLESAEETYADLKADNDAADAVDALIDAITLPVAYPASKEAIDAARTAYEALTPTQKELVDDLADLVDAENTYKVAEVEVLIETIGTVEYTAESKAKIDIALGAFEALTPEQKELVLNHTELPAAQDIYDELAANNVKALIAGIGEVKHPKSKEAIQEARTAYDELTEKQKELVDNYDTLTEAEEIYASYDNKEHVSTVMGWVLFVLVILELLYLALYFILWYPKAGAVADKLKLGALKPLIGKIVLFGFIDLLLLIGSAASVLIFILALAALAVYATPISIATFILAFLVMAAYGVLIFFRWKKRGEEGETAGEPKYPDIKETAAPAEEVSEEVLSTVKEDKVPETTAEPVEEEKGEEVIVVTENGATFRIQFVKSFTAKLIQSSDETKRYYRELKNEILSYKGINSRASWNCESFNFGRKQAVKIAVRGKTLCLYFALDMKDLKDSKYRVELCESAKYAAVPCMYRIRNDRRCEYAKDLIAMVAEKFGLVKGENPNKEYSFPYEDNAVLLAKGLIKEVKSKIAQPVANEHIHLRSVTVSEADAQMTDEVAATFIEDDVDGKAHSGKKGIINIDVLSANFSDGDTVDIEALWEKKLVPASVGRVKLLARGSLDKALNVDLQDYSLQAVKMIVLVGGTVHRAK